MTVSCPALIVTSDDAIAHFAPLLAGLCHEALCIAYVDDRGRLIELSERLPGACGEVDLPIRVIARDAVRLDARGVILAHNHPSGDPTPSHADLAATRRLAGALAVLDIRVVDHLVLSAGGWRSFRAMGQL
ncbi:JAB domain-containing protein [Sphingomonas sp. DBB INV C78]|uniref:JAB domain-containing protein n=1 Tax=Sphingomonas sp. DBB INV C78 TaxID=3349434 RepID=UPI0036D30335